MTQPPDDRLPPPGEPEPSADGDQSAVPLPEEPPTPENAPTVAWTPPDSAQPPPPPSGPIISADASPPPAEGWQVPGAPSALPVAVSGGGWEVPAAAGSDVQREGYVAGGIGARFVAWLIDTLLASIVPGALFLLVFDWNGMLHQVFDQMRFDASGRLIPNYSVTYTIPITLDLVLVYLVTLGIQFLYFVGFWTSRWQATPGMIGLKMRVVDAQTGAGLTLMKATKRWIAMGFWLGLLFLVPALQSAGSLAQFAVNLFLFFSIVTNDRNQGLHDRFAGSQVIRSVTSGNGATFVGCLVYGVMLIMLGIAAGIAVFAIAGPTFVEFARDLPRYQP
jgi:uncharacterized RDD family membrane protein YckC